MPGEAMQEQERRAVSTAPVEEVKSHGVDDQGSGDRAQESHLIVRISGALVDVQVRTSAQHLWAELSEKLSDVVDPGIKYGGGIEFAREALRVTSEALGHIRKDRSADHAGA